jgi:hypothetical protein
MPMNVRYRGVGPTIAFTAPDAPSTIAVTLPPRILAADRTDQSP